MRGRSPRRGLSIAAGDGSAPQTTPETMPWLMPHERWLDRMVVTRNQKATDHSEANRRAYENYGPIGFRLFGVAALDGAMAGVVVLSGIVLLVLSPLFGETGQHLAHVVTLTGVVGEIPTLIRCRQTALIGRRHRGGRPLKR